MNLSKVTKVTSAVTPTAGAAGTTDIEGTTLDMQGFDGVMAIVRMGTITSTAVTSIKMQQGAASDLSDAADLLGTAITVADDDDGQTFIIDLYKPRERYVRVYVDRGTANAVVASAEYVQYGPRNIPTTMNVTDAVTCETHISPAEGTA